MSISPLISSTLQSHKNPFVSHDNNKGRDLNAGKTDSFPIAEDAARGISVPEARKLLNDKILAALDKTLTQSNQTSLYELDPADFTPEIVADRILSFISAAFSNIDSTDKEGQRDKLEQARQGVEKGFNDAKEILEGLGVFKGDIADNANKTYDLLQQGLDKIAANIESGASIVEGLFGSGNQLATDKSTLFQQSFNFELTTKDGDKITININKLEASHESAFITESENQSQLGHSSTTLSQSGYSIAIDGQLDDEEVAAIDKLLSEVTEVANNYFSGDTQAALDKVTSLGYNSSEIASYSLSMKEIQQTKATSTYQAIGELQNDKSSRNVLGQIIQPLRDYAALLTEANGLFSENRTGEDKGPFQQLLDQIARLNGLYGNEDEQDQFNELNSAVLERLV